MAATIALAAGPAAGATDCPVTGVVSCPSTQPPAAPTTTSTTVASAPSTPTGPTTTTTSTTVPAQASQDTPEQARAKLAGLVNAERVQRGLGALTQRDDITNIAMPWSASMAQAGTLSHNDAYFSKDTRRRLDAQALGENVARASSIENAHRALMASDHHRANILDARFSAVGYGAVFQDGSWWVTEDFLQARAVTTAPRAAAHTTAGGVERPRDLAAPSPDASQVSAARASSGSPDAAATPPAEHLELVPTVPSAVVTSLDQQSTRKLRIAAVEVALLLMLSATALRKAKRRAVRITAR